LASILGQAVLVVAAGQTQQTDVEAALDLLQACPHISLLLNKMPTWSIPGSVARFVAIGF
jgi:hypothetical protein